MQPLPVRAPPEQGASRPDPILQGPLLPIVLGQGVVLALAMASHALFNIVDLALIGKLADPAAIGGVHVATNMNFLPMVIGNGVSAATMSMMARMLGAGQIDRARDLSSRSQVLMLLLGIVIGTVGALLVVPSVDLQGVTGRGRQIGMHYLLVVSLGTFTMFVLMQTTATMRALGESLMPFCLLVGANVLNILLDIVFLFGWEDLGVPAFGAPGAAYATVISRGIAAGLGLAWLRRPDCPLRLSWVPLRGPRGQRREVFFLGMPQAVQMLVRALAAIGLTRIAGELAGQPAIYALGVTMRFDTLVLFAAIGFGSTGTAIAGRNAGAGQYLRARRAAHLCAGLALLFGACFVVFYALFPAPLMQQFVDPVKNAGVVEAGVGYLTVATLSLPLSAFCIAATGAINGGGRFVVPMLIDVGGYLGLLIPGAILITVLVPDAPLARIWWLLVGVNLLLALVYWLYVQRGRWARDA